MAMTHAQINFSLSPHLGVWGVPLGLRGKGTVSSGMVSSGKVSCIVFVMHVECLLLRVMCVLMHVHVLVGVTVSVIMCILVWICVHVCIALPIVVGAWPMAGTLWRLFFEYYYYSTMVYQYGRWLATSVLKHPHSCQRGLMLRRFLTLTKEGGPNCEIRN